MIKDKKSLPKSRVKLTITATAAQFRDAFAKELAELSEGVQIQGFRKGKAPESKVIEKLGRQRIEAGAMDRVISHLYYQDIQDAKLVPVSSPTVEVTEYTAPSDETADDAVVMTFTLEVDLLPEVKIDGYQKIKLPKNKAEEVTKEDVDKIIDYLRKQQAILKEVDEGTTVKKDMWTDLGYEGSVDGVMRSDMKNDHHPIVVGEGQLIPGFEDALIGMKKGETKTFPITFPKDYHAKELAGKKAEFTVTIHELKEVTLPVVDNEFAEKFDHRKVEDLTKAIEESVAREKDQEFKAAREEGVVEQLLKLAKFDLPQSMVEQEMDRMFADGQKRLSQVPGQWETYLQQTGKTAEALREETREQAEKNVRVGLSLGKVIELEGIKDEPAAGQRALERLVEIASK